MQSFKWGVIGARKKANVFANDLSFAAHPHALAVIATEEGGENFPGAMAVNSLEEFLQTDIDAVYIASPYHMHYEQVAQCLKHGKPVLCERPIAGNAGQLRSLMQLAADHNTFMMEAMWIRFLPSIKKILSIVSSGTIGEVIAVKASISYKTPEGLAHTISDGGSTLMELGIYPVFLTTLFLGKPEYVQATGKSTEGSRAEFFSAFLSYRSGQYSFLETTMNLGTSSALIQGDKGSIQIKNPWSAKPEGIEVDLADGTKVLHKCEWAGQGLHFELDEVLECVRAGSIESRMYCHHFMLDVMHTLDAVRTQLS